MGRLEVRNIVVISLGSLMVLSLFTMFTEQAFAVPTNVVHQDTAAACDTLVVPDLVDELGNQPPFPVNEWISSSQMPTDLIACPLLNNDKANVEVSITNNSPFAFSDLWYVADKDTSMSNFDGAVGLTGFRTFKIDSVGINKPLISESITVNGIFESGETWRFIIDSYIQTPPVGSPPAPPLPASNFGTIGVPSGGGGLDGSTGSIIAISVDGGDGGVTIGGTLFPIDTTALLLYYIQGTAAWMIPAIVAAVGIGIVLARKF